MLQDIFCKYIFSKQINTEYEQLKQVTNAEDDAIIFAKYTLVPDIV